MRKGKVISTGVCVCGCVLVLFVLFAGSVEASAKSVFAVAAHSGTKIKAYQITADEIEFQSDVEAEDFVSGATGLCVWSSLELMFVTYEGSNKIAWASTKTLQRDSDDEIEAPESNLAGVISDELNSVLYVITRDTNHLYTYSYDVFEDTLELVHPNDPEHPAREYRALEGLSNAYGLALDEDGGPLVFGLPTGLLYVADGTSTVRYYNTMTWEFEDSVDVVRSAVGIDVDGTGYLYAGGYSKHDYLIRYELDGEPNEPETLIEKDLEAEITDISIDRDTGLLYTTTRRIVNGHTGTVEVYDASEWTSTDPNSLVMTDWENDDDFSGPGGIAVGPSYKPPDVYIDKVDDVNEITECIIPDDYITYSICFRPGPQDQTNVVITDTLPWGVDFISADPNTGYYTDRPVHTYTWEIGDVEGYDPNHYFTLFVQVNNGAEPAGELINIAEVESDDSFAWAEERTPVCCWCDDIIYVDKDAEGAETGVDWENAYTDLQDALARATKVCGDTIWVAEGIYKPGTNYDDTFEVPDGVEVYGGFAGCGAPDPNERDWKKYKTILSGFIGMVYIPEQGYVEQHNETVVTMGDETILDGFIVEEGDYRCVKGINASFSIVNCVVKDSGEIGIYCENGDLSLQWCKIENNGQQGILHQGSGYVLNVANCNIYDNQWDAILTDSSILQIINSLLYDNGQGEGYYGINLLNPSSSPTIRNNTIVHNVNEGIKFTGSNAPNIRNCIIYFNNDNDIQLAGYDATYYCCIYDPNNPQGTSTKDENDNITCDPNFAYDYPVYGYYHLDFGSHCRDAGDSDQYTDEFDIDGDSRIFGNLVDIGADEATCEDVSNIADFTADGLVRMEDFYVFSMSFPAHDPNDPLTDPNHPYFVDDPNAPGYIDPDWCDDWENDKICNIDGDLDVDVDDFIRFAAEWLWEACWHENYNELWMMFGMGGGESLLLSESLLSVQKEEIIQTEPTLMEQIEQAKAIVDWLDEVSKDKELFEYIDKKTWSDFVESIYDWLDTLDFDVKLKE